MAVAGNGRPADALQSPQTDRQLSSRRRMIEEKHDCVRHLRGGDSRLSCARLRGTFPRAAPPRVNLSHRRLLAAFFVLLIAGVTLWFWRFDSGSETGAAPARTASEDRVDTAGITRALPPITVQPREDAADESKNATAPTLDRRDAFAQFDAWRVRYLTAPPVDRDRLIREGAALARARR